MNEQHRWIGRHAFGDVLVAYRLLTALVALGVLAATTGALARVRLPSGQVPPMPPLIFSPWVKFCNKATNPDAEGVCVTVSDGRLERGELVVSVAVMEMDRELRKLLRVRMPYGVALQHGTRLIIDQGQPATAAFVACLPPAEPPGGCVADYQADADLIARLKDGRFLTVQAIHMNGQAISQQLELLYFPKAYDGPPTDPGVIEQQQKQLQDRQRIRRKDDTLQPHLRPWN